ncbi:MAG: hypothetical protein V1698_00055 [bacterium]
MSKTIKQFFIIFIAAFFLFAIPRYAGAWSGVSSYCTDPGGGCSVCDGITMAKAALDWVVNVSISIAFLSITIGGAMYIFAGANSGMVKTAHKIFSSTGIGLGFIFGAWLIVNIILLGTGAAQFSASQGLLNPQGWFVIVCK